MLPPPYPGSTADAVMAIDGSGSVVAWNDEATHLFGWARDEVMGRALESTLMPRTAGPPFPAELGSADLDEIGNQPLAARRMRTVARHRDGSPIPVEFSLIPVELADRTFYTAVVRPLVEEESNPETHGIIEERVFRRAIESRLVSQAMASSIASTSFEEALRTCIGIVCDVTGWRLGHAWTRSTAWVSTCADRDVLVSTGVWQRGELSGSTTIHHSLPVACIHRGEHLPGRIWETGEAAWTTDIADHPVLQHLQGIKLPELHGAFGFPVVAGEDIVAVLEFFSIDDVTPDPQLLLLVGSIGQQLGQVHERQRWEQERDRLAAIVDSSSDAIVSFDLDGCITSWNRGAEAMYGYPALDAMSRPLSLLLPEGVKEELPHEPLQFQTRRRHKDGRLLDVSVTVSPIRDSSGQLIGISAIERDVTDRTRREQELKKAKDQAEAANRAKSEFVANISHELRTPMNAIIGMVELTLRQPSLDQAIQDHLTTAKDSAHLLLGLVDDLLDFSRMEAGRFELDVEPFDLRLSLDQAMRILAVRAHTRGLELVCHVDPSVPNRLEGDPRRLRQIVMNLVANAIKFTPQGEVVVGVSLKSQTESEVELLLSVRDTGIGISPADQERIFKPFTQVDASLTREQTGAGLGLTICKELVEKMGGQIWLESTKGAGTTFWCNPRLKRLPDTPSVAAIGSPRWQGMKALVVDDNATTRRTMEEILAHWGFVVQTSAGGRDALGLLAHARQNGEAFDVLLVDALMPDVDGLTLIETLHRQNAVPRITFVLGSLADRELLAERLTELQVAATIEKPVSESALFDSLATAVEGPVDSEPVQFLSQTTDKPLDILVAEDTPPNQKVVKAILEHRGHRAQIAQNGREAVDLATARHFDVILMDVQMPTMDGLQATAAIRNLPDSDRARVPIVALTAHAMRRDRERCLSAGMNGYVSKPIDAESLIRMVEDLGGGTRGHHTEPRPHSDQGVPKMTFTSSSGTARSPGESEPTVNLERALERMGGDRGLLIDMAKFYVDDVPPLLEQTRRGLAEKNIEELTRAAHSLKGLSATFDAHAAVAAALAVETAGRAGNLAAVESHLPSLETEIQRVVSALQREIA